MQIPHTTYFLLLPVPTGRAIDLWNTNWMGICRTTSMGINIWMKWGTVKDTAAALQPLSFNFLITAPFPSVTLLVIGEEGRQEACSALGPLSHLQQQPLQLPRHSWEGGFKESVWVLLSLCTWTAACSQYDCSARLILWLALNSCQSYKII